MTLTFDLSTLKPMSLLGYRQTKFEHFGIIHFYLCSKQTNKQTNKQIVPNILSTPTDRVCVGKYRNFKLKETVMLCFEML